MGGIGVISNPRSGKNRRNPGLARRLAYILGEKDMLHQPHHLDALTEVARHFRDHSVDILCINGGDGTAHTVLSTFLREYAGKPMPMVALLRGGTMNTMSKNIGLRGTPESILGRVVNAYAGDESLPTVERNLMVVDGQQAGFLFGNGLMSSFLEAYYEGGDASPWKAIKVLVRTVSSALVGGKFIQKLLKPVRVTVEVDGQTWEPREYLAVGAGTMADIGLGFRPYFRCLAHPDHMHAVGFACTASEVVKQLPRVLTARPMNSPNIIDAVCRRMIIEADGPQPYMIDGDFHRGGDKIVVEIGPRLRLLTG